MKKFKFALLLLAMYIPPNSYAVKFIGSFYDPGSMDDMCTTLHMRFTLEGYTPLDIVSVDVFEGTDEMKKLKEHVTRFNTEINPSGSPQEGENFFTIRDMIPGKCYTFVFNINKDKYTEPLKMLGPGPKLPLITTFKMYPNPTKDIFTVESPLFGSTITIYNTAGQMVYSTTMNFQKETIDIYLANGLYIVTIEKGGFIDSKKLFINR